MSTTSDMTVRLKLYPLPTKPASPHCPTDHGTRQPPPPQLLRAAASHPTIAQPSPSAAHTAAPASVSPVARPILY
uniref:Uncharacterized protein n=1 Tax=Oryza rufipogon TaxID=4529 RepID=A0A0E0PRG0_ORYRU